jgi:hypothetical protein
MRQNTELRAYQRRFAEQLVDNTEAFCVARMGAGKSAAALTAIATLIQTKATRHALVLAPKRVARNVWPEEIADWAHLAGLKYEVLMGSPGKRKAQLATAHERDITICGLDIVQWLIPELLEYPEDHALFDLLVIDEVSRLRNPTSKRAQLLAKHSWRFGGIWGLSGTLRPNSAEDLFMPARIVTDARLWGKSFYKWQREHFYPTDFNGYRWAPLPGAEDKLNAELAPLVIALAPDEMPQMPALTVIKDRIQLPPAARADYDTMHEELFVRGGPGEEDIVAVSAAVATGKLAQIANGFLYEPKLAPIARHVHTVKMEWLAELVEGADEPLLLIYEFVEDLDMMLGVCGAKLPWLGPGVGDRVSDERIKAWNARELPFLAMHPASGGHGLNLQHGGSTQLWVAPTWSPEYWEQTIARLHRPGQADKVTIRVCVADHTVDDLKLNRVHYKMSRQAAFEAYLADMAKYHRAASASPRARPAPECQYHP